MGGESHMDIPLL